MSFIAELNRRNVFRVALAYLALAWLLTEVADTLFPAFGIPDWGFRFLVIVFALGFVPTLIFSWAYEITPEGLKRDKDVVREDSITPITAKRLDKITIGLIVVAGAFVLVDRLWLRTAEPGAPAAVVDEMVVPPATDNEAAAPNNSIAVLSFTNMSSDKEQEYFADGLSDTLIQLLAQVSGLKVIANNSSSSFKGKNINVGEIARELNVSTILQGSVQKAGNRIRVIAKLINAGDGTHLWSDSFDRDLKDIFAIQDEIAQEVVRALKVTLLDAEEERLAQRYQLTLEAYYLFLQGRFHVAKRGGDLLRGINLLEQAVALDPDLAEAHAVLARAHSVFPIYYRGSSPLEARDRTMQSAGRALELEPDNASALAAMGMAKAWYEFDFGGALEALEKAVKSNRGSAEIHNFMGDFLRIIGDFETSLVHERKAAELDPMAAVHHLDLLVVLTMMGRYEEAIAEADRALEIDPTFFLAYSNKILTLLFSGKFEAAFETIAIAENLAGERHTSALQFLQCSLNAAAGQLDRARENLKILTEYSEAGQHISGLIAACYVSLRDFDNAGHWLEQAFTEQDRALTITYFIRLPEQAPDSAPWQSFWKHPEMAALAELRRSFGMPIGITATSIAER